jgi:hypothetical protein
MNIMAKHDGQAIVASRELQNWHTGASVELAAPQFGQFRVSACINHILAGECKVDYELVAVRCFPKRKVKRAS